MVSICSWIEVLWSDTNWTDQHLNQNGLVRDAQNKFWFNHIIQDIGANILYLFDHLVGEDITIGENKTMTDPKHQPKLPSIVQP